MVKSSNWRNDNILFQVGEVVVYCPQTDNNPKTRPDALYGHLHNTDWVVISIGEDKILELVEINNPSNKKFGVPYS